MSQFSIVDCLQQFGRKFFDSQAALLELDQADHPIDKFIKALGVRIK